jgi:hypothetical protein
VRRGGAVCVGDDGGGISRSIGRRTATRATADDDDGTDDDTTPSPPPPGPSRHGDAPVSAASWSLKRPWLLPLDWNEEPSMRTRGFVSSRSATTTTSSSSRPARARVRAC